MSVMVGAKVFCRAAELSHAFRKSIHSRHAILTVPVQWSVTAKSGACKLNPQSDA